MLSKVLICVPLLLSSCQLTGSTITYCAPNERLDIDLARGLIIVTSGGTSDQQFSILPCSHSIRSCFLGEISFVNPYTSNPSENPNIVAINRNLNGSYNITTQGGGTRATYDLNNGESFPRQWRIHNTASGEDRTFMRCFG
jgi:hypothetical protein